MSVVTENGNGAPLIEARGLTKRYGSITAVDDVELSFGRGEVVAIVGDNGAGKSTVIKMISGAVVPDQGEIRVEGQPATIRTPSEARGYGIETIYQDLAVAPNLDVVTNIYLGRERRRRGPAGWLGLIDRAAMRREAREHLTDLRINIPKLTGSPVESLSGGQRQSVAIARAMVWASKMVIMDEPTAALGVRETAHVLELIKRISNRGLPVVLISHDMPAVFEVSDRIHVHRLGKRVGVVDPRKVSMSDVVSFITGAEAIPEEAIAD